METVIILLVFAAFCFAMALLCVKLKWRESKPRVDDSSTDTRIVINCDTDGNVTVITNDPSRVKVKKERRS